MKTITEFVGALLNSAQLKDKELTASGKSAEELPAAREQVMTELTRYEGEKLKHFLAALEAVGNKTERLKRVVVWQVTEGEKGPKAALSRDGFSYIVEHYPHPHGTRAAAPREDEGRGDRRGRRGGKDGKRSRGAKGDRGDRGGRGRERSPGQELASGAGQGTGAPGAESKRRERKKGPGPKGLGTGGLVKPNNPSALPSSGG